jgi:hypothetical protein
VEIMAVMSDSSRSIEVRRLIDAPAARIFDYLARPDHHPALDSSGMIRSSAHHRPLTAVGQVFLMNMHNDMRGDHQVANHVVVFEPDRALGWAPAEPGPGAGGASVHLASDAPRAREHHGEQTYDWAAFTHLDMLAHLPVVDRDQLLETLDRLAAAVAGR